MPILSIQSHVSYGHAGNSSAVFPLQRMGHIVWPIYTVQFSNHTGYGKWKGQIFSPELVKEVATGIFEIAKPQECEAILTGYLGSSENGKSIQEIVKTIKEKNPEAIYCCDTVFGDYGRGIYAMPGIAELFKEEVIHNADIITPNQFEAEFLTEKKIENLEQAKAVALELLEKGPKVVIITSLTYGQEETETIDVLLATKEASYVITTENLKTKKAMAGTGDLFTSLFLGNYLKKNSLKTSLENTVASIFEIIKKTTEQDSYELHLIQNQESIVSPSISFEAKEI